MIKNAIRNLRHIAHGTLAALLAVAAMPSHAQDKLANMAPVDVKMRAIDSVSIMRLIEREEAWETPAENLYPDWNNEYTNGFGVEPPTGYKIDQPLRLPPQFPPPALWHGHQGLCRRHHRGRLQW